MTKEKTIEILNAVLSYANIGRKEFSLKIGIENPQWIADVLNPKKKVGISKEKAERICIAFPELNQTWLLTGEGEMYRNSTVAAQQAKPGFKSDFKESANILVPLINIDSVGGMEGHNTEVVGEEFIEALIPFPDARPNDWAIHQSGESMAPAIPSGAILQIRQVIDWQEYFGYGNVYVLWLKDDRRITKLVKKYDPDPQNYVLCCSYHPDFADEELPRRMIRQVWKVVNVLINKGW